MTHAKEQWLLRRAYPLYERWFAAVKRSAPNMATFASSTFGSHFTKFIEWCDSMNVTAPEVYVQVMQTNNIHPREWSTVAMYKLYIEQFDDVCSIDTWLLLTVSTIARICEDRGIPTSQFYTHVPPNHLVHLLRTKALYPRYLVCDPKFADYVTKLPKPLAVTISSAIPDRFLTPTSDCDPTILAVIDHLNK